MRIIKKNLWKRRWENREIDPDEILLDATNLPKFDQSQFEGRLEKPLKKSTVVTIGIVFALMLGAFMSKIFILQIEQGKSFAQKSAANSLRQSIIFQELGVIYDRNGIALTKNIPNFSLALIPQDLPKNKADRLAVCDNTMIAFS